ncbi:hypothetical protein HYV79_01690 [Candidatus Woesearchaeota archaeon]|nr:hypothetical protein [Candidatus Woesearchaeota archaeon]
MTVLLFDTDSLIKITKAGAKEHIVNAFEVLIPTCVKEECIDKAEGKPDALIIKKNVEKNKIKIIKTKKEPKVEKEILELGLMGGEQDVYRISTQVKYDLLSSDDQKFLRLLQNINKKAVTPGSLIVLMYMQKKISKEKAITTIKNLQQNISCQEYESCMNEIK